MDTIEIGKKKSKVKKNYLIWKDEDEIWNVT